MSAERASAMPKADTERVNGAEWRTPRRAEVDPEIIAEVQERLAPLFSMVHDMTAGAATAFESHDTRH